MKKTKRLLQYTFFLGVLIQTSSCTFFHVVKASDYKLSDYFQDPQPGLKFKDFRLKKGLIYVYEENRKKAINVFVNSDHYKNGANEYTILLTYSKLKVENDLYSDDELIPIIFNKQSKIIVSGWPAYDSLRSIPFLLRK